MKSPPRRRASALCAVSVGILVVALHQGTFFFPVLDEDAGTLGALAEARDLIHERWVEEPDPDGLRDGALKGMVGDLARLDPFSDYVPPADLQAFEEHTTGQFGGLGVYLDVFEGKLTVVTPFPDTPAWKTTIQPGDVIEAIDGVPAEFRTVAQAVEKLKGKAGTRVALAVLHEDGRRETVTLERAVIQRRSVKGERVLEDGIGYLLVDAFNAGTVAELDIAIADLEKSGVRAVILDLRGNPGGYLKGAVEVADRFLPEDRVVVTTRGRGGVLEQELRTEQSGSLKLPVALLVDAGTASAAEILAGALQDQGVATVVGTRSYGKGSVQSLLDMMGGKAQLKLTTQYFFTPKGRRIHRGDRAADDTSWGINPDIEVGIDPVRRREMELREGEIDVSRIAARRRGKPWEGEERYHLDDPQVAAAFAHLTRVLLGEERIGHHQVIASPAPIDSNATASAPPPGEPEPPKER